MFECICDTATGKRGVVGDSDNFPGFVLSLHPSCPIRTGLCCDDLHP